jgi:hypothetical protein
MDAAMIALVSLLVGGIALGLYMDWFGLWVSKEQLAREIARPKATAQPPRTADRDEAR